MKRRDWIAAAGVGAAAAGVGWNLWSGRRAEADAGGLWAMRFERPDGGDLLAMSDFRGRPLLLNFWATWCAPCIREMPLLDRFARDLAGRSGRVVGLAIDNPIPVQDFLRRNPVTFGIGVAGFDGTELARNLGNADGALPFTALFDADGRIARRRLGENTAVELARWLETI